MHAAAKFRGPNFSSVDDDGDSDGPFSLSESSAAAEAGEGEGGRSADKNVATPNAINTHEDSADCNVLEVGQQVQARFGGQQSWFPGTIEAVDDTVVAEKVCARARPRALWVVVLWLAVGCACACAEVYTVFMHAACVRWRTRFLFLIGSFVRACLRSRLRVTPLVRARRCMGSGMQMATQRMVSDDTE
jgi:hypothetical protein